MTTKVDVLDAVADRAIELLGYAQDPETSMREAARAFGRAGVGMVGLDTDDADAFIERLIADNPLLCLKLRARPVDAVELTSAATFEGLVETIVHRCIAGTGAES